MLDFWHVMNKCTVIAKKELLYTGPFGIASWLSGLIFIDRKNAAKAHTAMNESTTMLKEKRIKLWVFPEGTRRNTNEIHPFKKGAFHVAVGSQLPIMPVVYSSYGSFLDDKAKILNNGHVIVTTMEPIETKGLTSEDIPELMERVRSAMLDTFRATTKEVENKYNVNRNNGSATGGLSGSKLMGLRCIDDLIKPKMASRLNAANGSPAKESTVYRRKD